jgi:hypothetical protein
VDPADISNVRLAGHPDRVNSPAGHDPSILPAPRLADLRPVALVAPALVPALVHALDLAHLGLAASRRGPEWAALQEPHRLREKLHVHSAPVMPRAAVDASNTPRRRKAR